MIGLRVGKDMAKNPYCYDKMGCEEVLRSVPENVWLPVWALVAGETQPADPHHGSPVSVTSKDGFEQERERHLG